MITTDLILLDNRAKEGILQFCANIWPLYLLKCYYFTVTMTLGAEQVTEWLSSLGFPELAPLLIDEGYDSLERIAQIEDDDLIEIGVKRGHRKAILRAAAMISSSKISIAPHSSTSASSHAKTSISKALSSIESTSNTNRNEFNELEIPSNYVKISFTFLSKFLVITFLSHIEGVHR